MKKFIIWTVIIFIFATVIILISIYLGWQFIPSFAIFMIGLTALTGTLWQAVDHK
jgi:hypothetical protein